MTEHSTKEGFKIIDHRVDFCVVGGGLSGMCAAVAAARHGLKVALIQERPMLGGNASSEIRMWVCGAKGENMLETGLIEEIMMENQYRNPDKNYSVWDGILYDFVNREENITLIMNCTVNECETDGDIIKSVTGWQMTTQQFHRVEAAIFADCSGDSVLAPISGALYRVGREERSEFNEKIAPEKSDSKTMGMSCMIQAREEARKSEFIPPKWAYKFTKEDLPHRVPNMEEPLENFWYMEVGGDGDSIRDTEKKRDELLKIAYGVWDFVKNDPENKEKYANWRLDWVGILPGKRESRRYVGDYIMNENDVEAEGRFDDIIAYGGWPMDDHGPKGFWMKDLPNINYPAPSPYGIPYRCLHSKNIKNLMFAGRNISVTHWALSSTRVMGTCALLGQAAGTAAAIAVKNGITPRGVYESHVPELKQTLMDDDSYLPFNRRDIPQISKNARISGNIEKPDDLINGYDRPIGDNDNGVYIALGDSVEFDFGMEKALSQVRIVFDSDLSRVSMPDIKGSPFYHNMMCNKPLNCPDFYVPKTMVKAYRIEGVKADGTVETVYETRNNYQRLNKISVNGGYAKIRFTPLETWGAEEAHVFSIDIKGEDE